MTRWAKEPTIGHLLPPIEHHDRPVPLDPFHQRIYEYVYFDDTTQSQSKRGVLRQVSLEPLLIRRYYHPTRITAMIEDLQKEFEDRQDDRGREILRERIRALEQRLEKVSTLSTYEQADDDLREAHQKFIEWRTAHNPDEKFDEDFLIKIGYDNLALWSFFNLNRGVDEIVQRSKNPSMIADWQGKREIFSSKYRVLKDDIDQDLRDGKKVMIFSGFYQREVTSGVEDIAKGDDLAFLSLYDHLRSWYGHDTVLKIDGTVNVQPKRGELAERERVRRAWRLQPEKKIILMTVRSSRLGIDLSIPPIRANADITGLEQKFIDLPDTYADIEQSVGRGHGPGQIVPVGVTFYKTTNAEQPKTFRYGYIDHGMWEAIEFKRLLSQMVLDGIPLTEEEEEKVTSHLSSFRIELFPKTPRNYLSIDFFNAVRGKGSRQNLEFFKDQGFEDIPNIDFFTTYYPDYDHLSTAGHNARAVSQIIRKHEESLGFIPRIGSVGSGAGILQITLGEPVVNIDMLEEMVRVGKRRGLQSGEHIVGEASSLPIRPEAFDITDASFMIHWSNNKSIALPVGYLTSERAGILEELNRVTKMNGLVIITIPPRLLTTEQFSTWKQVLESYFGFRTRDDIPSGFLRATDFKTEQVGWIFNLEKVGEVKPGFSVKDLSFDFEKVVEILYKTRQSSMDQSASQPVPHLEFEIVEPTLGRIHKIQYIRPDESSMIEELLLGQNQTNSYLPDDLEIISKYGIEELGLYRRLVRETKSRFGLSSVEAENLSREAIKKWAEGDFEHHDVRRMWSELRSIVEEIRMEVA